MSIILLIIGLILFVSLVVVHEFGHFIVARRNKVKVEEFAIGFPPRAWGRKTKDGYVFSINWLPLGGFVRLKGEHDADKAKGSYGAANIWAKSRIMLAGVGMNLLTAFILITIVAWLGMPKLVENQFTVKRDTKVTRNQVLIRYVEPKSPAAEAVIESTDASLPKGLQDKDRLLFIRSSSCGVNPSDQELAANPDSFSDSSCFFRVKSADELPNITKSLANESGLPVIITIERGGKIISLRTDLRTPAEVQASQSTDNPKGYLGIEPVEFTLLKSTWSAPAVAVGLIVQFTVLTFQGLGHAIGALLGGHAAQASSQVTGPVGIFALLKSGSVLGYQFILTIVAIISLTLAIMNILPIPALDGGRLFVTWFFRIMHRPLKRKTEELIHGTGFALLMLLFVLITIVDIRRFF